MEEESSPAIAVPSHVSSFLRFRPSAPGTVTPWVITQSQSCLDTVAEAPSATSTSKGARGIPRTRFSQVFVEGDRNEQVFRWSVLPVVESTLEGRNGCILCYGQTESGKTHTIFGYGPEHGMVPLSLQAIFDHFHKHRRTVRYRLGVSYYEVYNEVVRDLLREAGTPADGLRVREAAGAFHAEDLTVRLCNDTAAAMKALQYGTENKTVGYSYLHDRSSRAHTVFCIQLAFEKKVRESPTTTVSRLNFVDLAGSELLSYEFGSTQQEETKAINTSLLALRSVVSALANKEKHVPYRNSVLTKLLASTLGMNTVTAVLCTAHPGQQHRSQTENTIAFGSVSRSIEQQAKLNEYLRSNRGLKLKETIKENYVDLAQEKQAQSEAGAAALEVPIRTEMVPTRAGELSVLVAKNPAHTRLALCLHSYPGEGEWWKGLFPELWQRGYDIIAPDFPGFGRSPGQRMTSRTELFDQKNGVLEMLLDLIEFGSGGRPRGRRIVLCGYDYGGNMALYLGVYHPLRSRIDAIIVFHPNWTDKLETLANITAPLLLCWEPSNQLHLISAGRRMARIVKRSSLVSIGAKPGAKKSGDLLYAVLMKQIQSWMATMKLGEAPSAPKRKQATSPQPQREKQQQQVVDAKQDDESSSSSEELSEGDDEVEARLDEEDDFDSFSAQSSFLACLVLDPLNSVERMEYELRERKARKAAKAKAAAVVKQGLRSVEAAVSASPEPSATASVLAVKVAIEKGELRRLQDALLRRNGCESQRPLAMQLVGRLPMVVARTASSMFVTMGAWSRAPNGVDLLGTKMTRYPRGRPVLVPLDNVLSDFTCPQFGCVVEKKNAAGCRRFLTFCARFLAFDTHSSSSATCTVEVPCIADVGSPPSSAAMQKRVVASRDLFTWNDATPFPITRSSNDILCVAFEDAIMARYHDIVTRVKIWECALAVAPVVPKMDFERALDEIRDIVTGVDLNEKREQATCGGVTLAGPNNLLLLQQQIQCVEKIRACMDTIHHVRMGKDPSRLCVPDAGRLATYGQWHCHGMASVFASLLIPFSHALGLCVRYRDGFYLQDDDRDRRSAGWDGVPRALADHTWLEVTFYPSGATFIADPSFDDVMGVLSEVSTAYSLAGRMFPVRNLTHAECPGNIAQSNSYECCPIAASQ